MMFNPQPQSRGLQVRPLLAGRTRRAFTLIEVLVGLTIMTAGLLAVAAVFPYTLRAQRDAELLTVAASLAQQKAEEIRRDNDRNGVLITQIRNRPSPTAPIIFPREPRLTYSFSGQSAQYFGMPATDPRAMPSVPRVIIRYAPSYRPTQDVVYELRFN